MNTTYIDCCLYTYPAAEFFTFYFKLPRFQPLLDSCLHYHFEEGHLVSQKRGNCCFASDLLNSLGSSCHSGCLFSKGMEENLTKHFEWTGLHWKKNGRDKLPPRHTYIDIYIYIYICILHQLVSLKYVWFSSLFLKAFLSCRNYMLHLYLTINGEKLQQSPARHIFPLHIECASCSKFCFRGGHCTQWILACMLSPPPTYSLTVSE